MSYEHSKAIRKFALKTFKNMLVAVGESQNVQLLQQAMPMYVEQLQKALGRHDDKTAKILIKSLANNLRAMGKVNETQLQFLTEEQINAQAKKYAIKDQIFKLECGAIFRADPVSLSMVTTAFVINHRPNPDAPEESKIKLRQLELKMRERQ